MTPSVEFWFESASTYSHVAAQRIEAVARAAGVPIVWRPFLLGPIFRQQGLERFALQHLSGEGRVHVEGPGAAVREARRAVPQAEDALAYCVGVRSS